MGKGGGGKGMKGPLVDQQQAAETLNRFCQERQVKPDMIFTSTASGWHCTIKVPGMVLQTNAQAQNKKEAQQSATKDFAEQLIMQGLMKMPSKRQMAQQNAPLPPVGPSWAILGGAADIIMPDAKKLKGDGKGKKGKKGKEEFETPKDGRNVDSEYSALLKHVRTAEMPEALDVVQSRLEHDKGVLSVKHFSTLVTNISVRSNEAGVLEVLGALEAQGIVKFDEQQSRSYCHRFARWATREFLAEGVASMDACNSMSISMLERNGVCIPQLMAMQGGKSEMELALTSSGPLPTHNSFTRGDWLYLTFPQTARVGQYDGANGQLPATVEAELVAPLPLGQHGFLVKVTSAKKPLVDQMYGKYCRVDRAANHVTFGRQIEALQTLCAGKPGPLGWLRQILLRADEPGNPGGEDQLCAQYHGSAGCPNRYDLLGQANPSQYEALKAGTSQRVTLIQGPPGSGKTTTAVLLLALWTAARRGPILASADSNVAVDNIVMGCIKAGLNVIRVGRQEASRPELDEYNLLEKAKAAGIQDDERANFVGQRKLLQECEVVCATCSGAAHPVLSGVQFQCVLIDEAGQATELAKLVPLLHLTANGSAALVGDHKQLPATVSCLEADVEGLGTSLFERLASLGVPPYMLDVQYRMHPAIANFPSLEYYDGYLRTGVAGAQRPPPRGIIWPQEFAPVAFLPVDGSENKEGNSYVNDAEAHAIDVILAGVVPAGDIKAKDIGVITPYAAQARSLRRRFGCPPPGKRAQKDAAPLVGNAAIEVSSVDGYQGREKELIIVSTVRANVRGNVGFLSDPRRLNVMLTRAKRGLIVIGHFETLSKDDHGWRPFLVWCQQRGLVAGCPASCGPAEEELRRLCEISGPKLLNWQPEVDEDGNPAGVAMET
eukprot:TRINITY_DN8954_c0_g1_i1.p1 TRINITY_DN8954_c0_g1~~TRINITY_DN8954_c0_g1_i1.p1  ORF type:complete len:890 (+),score=226.83 TRINITY_DN8954_c0_g1_i1:131-2800(+)